MFIVYWKMRRSNYVNQKQGVDISFFASTKLKLDLTKFISTIRCLYIINYSHIQQGTSKLVLF